MKIPNECMHWTEKAVLKKDSAHLPPPVIQVLCVQREKSMFYKSDETIKVNDSVLIEDGKTPGTIQSVIETDENMSKWGLNEKGVMVESAPFGLVFYPFVDIEEITFVKRSKNKSSNEY